MRSLDMLATLLLVIGGLNWGLVALAKFDLVAFITGQTFGEVNALSAIVYGLVGLSAIYVGARAISRPRALATA